MFQQPRREPEIDFEQILNKIRATLGRFGGGGGSDRAIGYITLGLLGLSIILWLSTGFFTVGPGEQAALRTFGKCCTFKEKGLKWWWPAPIGTRNVESVRERREMKLGFSEEGLVSPLTLRQEAQMIAGDLNIVDVPLVVQYRISNLENYLFNVADPGEKIIAGPGETPGTRDIPPGRPEGRTLKDATEAALRLVVGQSSIDDVLTDDKPRVQEDTKILLQAILDSYEAGIEVIDVLLQEVKPPQQVRDAFEEVNRARQEQETIINLAQAFERDLIPRARGEAAKIIQEAEAFKRERIAAAQGEAGRFLSILREYQKAPGVTRQRLYLEAMEEILPNISKFVVSPEAQGTIILNPGGQIVPVPSPTQPPPASGE